MLYFFSTRTCFSDMSCTCEGVHKYKTKLLVIPLPHWLHAEDDLLCPAMGHPSSECIYISRYTPVWICPYTLCLHICYGMAHAFGLFLSLRCLTL